VKALVGNATLSHQLQPDNSPTINSGLAPRSATSSPNSPNPDVHPRSEFKRSQRSHSVRNSMEDLAIANGTRRRYPNVTHFGALYDLGVQPKTMNPQSPQLAKQPSSATPGKSVSVVTS